MRRSGPWRFAILCVVASQPAMAQVLWDMPNVLAKKPNFNEPSIKPRAEAWPRLDPGAAFCKTDIDLQRLAAIRRGEPTEPANCQIIRTPVAVQIERRAGPGRTQVAVTGQQGLDGWTDAWLPDKQPAIGGRTITIK